MLHFAAGEECGEPGTLSLIEEGFVGDWGITTEPTGLDIATAERGTVWLRIRISGRSTHAATPAAGANPIPPVEDVLAALRRYSAEIASRTHPLLGHPICTVTMVEAGAEHNAIPDGCELTIDRRMIPGETNEDVEEEIRKLVTDAVAGHDGISAGLSPIHHPFEAAEIPTESPFIETVGRAVSEVTGSGGDLRHAVRQRRPQPRQRREDGGDHVRCRRHFALPLPRRAPIPGAASPGGHRDGDGRGRRARGGIVGSASMSTRIGVDVGGTFTDLIAYDADSGEVTISKSASTTDAPRQAVIESVAAGVPPGVVSGCRVLPPRHDGRAQCAADALGRQARAARDRRVPRCAGDPPRQPRGDAEPLVAAAGAAGAAGAAHPDRRADPRRRHGPGRGPG